MGGLTKTAIDETTVATLSSTKTQINKPQQRRIQGEGWVDLFDYQELVIGQLKNQWKPSSKCHKPLKFDHIAHDNPSKSKKNSDQVSCPASTGKEKWMKLTGPVTFIHINKYSKTEIPTPIPIPTLPPTPFLGPGTFALNSQICNPLFEKILDPNLHNKGILLAGFSFL